MDQKRPVSGVGDLSRASMLNEPVVIKKRLDDMNPDNNFGLGVCRVVGMDYEEHFVTLRTLMGTEQEFERVPVPLTYPGAGARHFLGAMPEVGDHCVVGWMPQESSEYKGGTMTPVILSWIIPGVWPGRDWLTTAGFTEDEHDSGTSRNREEVHGVFDRIRHKLRHIQPGNIVASSSQGSDLILDESVILTNRRGNQFVLRDEDQAAVLRALQYFAALSGARTYAGMVQRDALRLPTTMFSDGREWGGLTQAVLGEPIPEDQLGASPERPGFLTPDPVFHRVLGDKLGASPTTYPDYLDPYVFLRNGGYIDEDGVAVDSRHLNDAVAGGKNIYRIGVGTELNAANNPHIPALTEHRIELTHTTDGRLPVTEQTDGFDAERLPGADPDTPGDQDQRAYIEWVLGSVVGNDPFTKQGRKEYGLPLLAEVFDSTGGLSPRVSAVALVPEGQTGGTPLKNHAATLFKLRPLGGQLADTFWSVNKQGQVRAYLSGPSSESSLDLALSGSMRLALGGALELLMKGGIHLGTLSKNSLRLRSEQGPVVIYGGGSDRDTESVMERLQGTNGGDRFTPAVDIEAKTNMRLKAGKQVLIKGAQAEINAQQVRVLGHDAVEVSSAKSINMSTEDMKIAVTGKRTESFTGPKNLLPTNGALHERTYASLFPGIPAEEVLYVSGDRRETFVIGNHSTNILIGTMSYRTALGTWSASALANSIDITPGSMSLTAAVGPLSLSAPGGTASMVATGGVLVQSLGGPVALRSNTLLTLGAPVTGTDIGPVLTAGSREPFSNLPFGVFGIGAKTVLVTP